MPRKHRKTTEFFDAILSTNAQAIACLVSKILNEAKESQQCRHKAYFKTRSRTSRVKTRLQRFICESSQSEPHGISKCSVGDPVDASSSQSHRESYGDLSDFFLEEDYEGDTKGMLHDNTSKRGMKLEVELKGSL